MKAKDILQLLSGLGITLSVKTLALLALALPLVVVFALKLHKQYRKRVQQKRAQGPALPDVPAGGGAEPAIAARELYKSWRSFLRRLPGSYQRSILNFEHFLVLGAASSGKSRLLDTQTDWLYQMKQVASEATLEPDLPTYLASGAVISELPSRYLEDHSESCRTALDRLWRPIYRRRTPTIVVALDVSWLSSSTPEARRDLALSIRMKVNQVSALRERPIEVRLALTHLDQIEGFTDAARFWVDQRISNRVPFAATGKLDDSLSAWEREMRQQVPRALRTLKAGEFHRFLVFLREVSKVLIPLAQFSDVLFEADPIALPALRGGAFLCSNTPGAESPLANATESGPGPNPLRRHALLTAGVACAFACYFLFAYDWERGFWAVAASDMANYKISRELMGSERELEQRATIRAFTVEHLGLLSKFPGFFAHARNEMRAQLTAKLREDLLLPQIAELEEHGILGPDNMTLRVRRVIYGLVVLHSYRADNLGVLRGDRRLELFSSMTGLRQDIIEDYLHNSSVPYLTPAHLRLQSSPIDERDTIDYWIRLPRAVEKGMADGILTGDELARMREQAEQMRLSLPRFRNDDVTLELVSNLDGAVDAVGEAEDGPIPALRAAYQPAFAEFVTSIRETNLREQSSELGRLITLITSVPRATDETDLLLRDLTDDLISLDHPEGKPSAAVEPIRLKLGANQFEIDVHAWDDAVRNSRAELLIDRFIARAQHDSIFFSQEIDGDLRNVTWNAQATDGSLFHGSAGLRGRYTKTAFERCVRHEVVRIIDVVSRLKVSADHKNRLADLIRGEVAAYARLYHTEVLGFLHGFQLHAPSVEALRVVLGQIAAENSTFDEFVDALDRNTDLSADGLDPGAADKPKAGAKAAPPVASGSPTANTDASLDSPSGAASAPLSLFSAQPLLQPVTDALREFESWHRAVGAKGKGAELGKYKEIVKQLLTDLTAVADVPDGKEPATAPLLDKDLMPAGKTALATIRADKGSYEALARKWAVDAGLTAEQQTPFLEPFSELWGLGRRDLETVVARAWCKEMLPLVRDVVAKFPFNRRAAITAEPAEIARLFHPVDGQFSALVAEYIAPISRENDTQGFQPNSAAAARVRFPPALYPTVNGAAALGRLLWDDKGTPRRLAIRVASVPFSTAAGSTLVPTASYLKEGDFSLLNFNQKPVTATFQIDWTSDEGAQIGVQVGNVETQDASFPAPLVAPGPYFRFLRLLAQARSASDPSPVGAETYEWQLRLQDGGDEKIPIRVKLLDDPWAIFSLQSHGQPLRCQ